MSDMGDAGAAWHREKGNRSDDHDEVFGWHGENKEHQNRGVGVIEGKRHEEAVDGARGPDGDRNVGWLAKREREEPSDDGCHTCTGTGDRVKTQEVCRPPQSFELDSEHPEDEHVEKDVPNATVQKHIGHGLPEAEASQDSFRAQAKDLDEESMERWH